MTTFGDIFCGGGGFSLGAIQAGLAPAWAIEKDVEIAHWYGINCGNHVITKDLRDVNPNALAPVDVLLASPPCQAHSQAYALKERSRKKRTDADLGLALLPFLSALRPKVFILENVMQYRSSKAYLQIVRHLWSLDYFVAQQILNSADFGVPSTRRRLILIAVRGGLVPPLPLPVKWVGWYEVIEDLIPELPTSDFAQWQMYAVGKARQKAATFAVDGKALKSKNRAGFRLPTVRFAREPWATITASQGKQAMRCQLADGDVRKITARAMARIQSVPDSYQFPPKVADAIRIIGNSVPPLMAQRILEAVCG